MNKLQQLEAEYSIVKRGFRDICERIEARKKAMDEMVARIKQGKIKSSDNVEALFNNEYELKLTAVELENL